jgi:hypothetical protein
MNFNFQNFLNFLKWQLTIWLFWLTANISAVETKSTTVIIYKYRDAQGVLHLSSKPPKFHEQLLSARSYSVPYSGEIFPQSTFNPPRAPKNIAILIDQVAVEVGLPSSLLHAVVNVESAYNSNAVSPKGAMGLMQLMPATAKRYNVTDRSDPLANLRGGARYLRDLLALFNQDLSLALAAYNAGENAVKRYNNQIPPYRETRNYVKRVKKIYRLLTKWSVKKEMSR